MSDTDLELFSLCVLMWERACLCQQNVLKPRTACGAILASMETPAERPSASSSFASLLASLTSPREADSTFDDSDLASDVASLSYESALRARARYLAANSGPSSAAEPAEPPTIAEALHRTSHGSSLREPSSPLSEVSALRNRALKNTSVTIRLSSEECAQLRNRAAEAGMTLSAYLRSCTFEVESLRAQVKQALAELRPSETAPQPSPAPEPTERARSRRIWTWLRRILPQRQSIPHAAHA